MKLIENFARSRELKARFNKLVPGGGHTYAKGDDQYPEQAPGLIARGAGCHVWDVDGNEFIEYGMGLRSVTLGHAYPPVVEAVRDVAGARHQLHAPGADRARVRRSVPDDHRRRRDGEVHQGRLDGRPPRRSSWRAPTPGRDLVGDLRRAPVLLVRRLVHRHDHRRTPASRRPLASECAALPLQRPRERASALFEAHPGRDRRA